MTTSPKRNSRKQTLSPQRSNSATSSTMSPKRRSSLPRPTPRKTPGKIVPAKPDENEADEEGIVVAVRMRPLNQNEGYHNRVWKVLPKYSSVTQTTREGKPLPERISGRTFFTFDKTFGENSTTGEVYDSVAKDIVNSVVTGLNGTIFAYGQTSSGKTYTMQGAGSIREGSMGSGGIVHMAAQDIFNSISKAQDRIFLVRASFLEIYNEEVRDLLANTSQTLQIREDPRRGVFVQSKEEIVTDFNTMLGILFQGESNRAFASTAMNERSSRSHTIFRITIESRKKGSTEGAEDTDSDCENVKENQTPEDDGAVLISTLNLVDLAGSESVRHTGATGDRQKEGGMINTSLLTLSRVIVALGTPNQTHINFRDSKLTRILQPSLSGNARMAVICCATPSELYLEETRSTMMFAARAKLVKTRAQVNEVLDDRSIIRKLQRELAEARRQGNGPEQNKQLKALEQKADAAGTAAKRAEEKLLRLKRSILNSGVLFGAGKPRVGTLADPVLGVAASEDLSRSLVSKGKRRLSEGSLGLTKPEKTPKRGDVKITSPHTTSKISTIDQAKPLSPTAELDLLRKALAAKNNLVKDLNEELDQSKHLLISKDSDIEASNRSFDELRRARDHAEAEATELQARLSNLQEEAQSTVDSQGVELKNKVKEINALNAELEAFRARSQRLEEALQTEKNEKQKTDASLRDLASFISSQLPNEEYKIDKQGEFCQPLEKLHVQIKFLCQQRTDALAQLANDKALIDNNTKEIERLRSQVAEKDDQCNEFSKKASDFEDKFQASRSKNEKLSEENTALKAKLATTDVEVERLTLNVQKLSSELATYAEKVPHLESVLQQRENEHRISLNSAEAAKGELIEARSMINSMNVAMERKRSEVAAISSNLQGTLNEIDCFVEALSPLGLQHIKTSEESKKLETLLDDIKLQQSSCKKGLEYIVAGIQSLEVQVSGVESSLQSTEGNLTEMIEEFAVEKRDIMERLSLKEATNGTLSLALKDAEAELKNLKEQISIQREEAQTQVATLKILLDQESYENNRLSNELLSKTEELTEKTTVAEKTEEQLKLAMEENQSLFDAKDCLIQALAEAESQVQKMENEVKGSEQEKTKIASNLRAATQELKAICESHENLKSAISSVKELQDVYEPHMKALTHSIAALEADNGSASAEIQLLGFTISELRSLLEEHELGLHVAMEKTNELSTMKKDLEDRLQTAQQKNYDVLASSNILATQLEESNAMREKYKLELEQVTEAKDKCERSLGDINQELAKVQESQEVALAEKAALEAELESSVTEIETMSSKIHELEASNNTFEDELRTAKKSLEIACIDKEVLQTKLVEATRNIDDSALSKKSLEQALKEAEATVSCLQNDLKRARDDAANSVSSMEALQAELSNVCEARDGALAAFESLRERQESSDTSFETLHNVKKELEGEAKVSKEKLEVFSKKIGDLEKALESTSAQLTEETLNTESLANEKIALESKLQLKCQEYRQIVASRDAIAKDLTEARSREECLQNDLSKVKNESEEGNSYMQAIQEELRTVQNARNKTTEALQALELEHAKVLNALEIVRTEKSVIMTELEETTQSRDSLAVALERAKTQLTDARDELNNARTDSAIAFSNHNRVTAELQAVCKTRDDAEIATETLVKRQEWFETLIDELRCSRDRLEAESEKTCGATREYGTKISQLESSLELNERHIVRAVEQVKCLKNEIISANQERDAAAKALQEVELQHKDTVNKYKGQISEMTAAIQLLNARIKENESTLELGRNEDRCNKDKVDALQQEKQDLEGRLRKMTQDLAEVGAERDSIKDALKKAESRVLGLEAKIMQLEANDDEKTNQLLQEARSAALAADDELAEKEKELQKVMYRLYQCEEELKLALDDSKETNYHTSPRNDLEEQLEELKEDYSNAVALLEKERTDRAESENKLKSMMGEEQRALIKEAESSMAALRNEKAELSKKLTASEAEAYAAREANEQYRDHAKRCEAKVEVLKGEIVTLKGEVQQLQQTIQDQEAESRTEISRLIANMNASKSELYAKKQSLMDLEERLRLATTSEESAMKDAKSIRNKASELERRVQAFEEENSNLKTQLQNLKADMENRVSTSSDSGDHKLHQKIKELQEESTLKDKRIKKLEQVRLTKEQCAALKQMKKDHAENKKKLAKAEVELARLRATKGSTSSSMAPGDPTSVERELAELQFDKEALEKKLRKYASHCQLLEDQKASIMDTLRSFCPDGIVDDEISNAVISLCDEHASLQEKVESLKSVEEQLNSSESELEKCRKEILVLQSQLEESRKAASSSNDEHQVKYLQAENLQLMVDLKEKSKQLQSARAENNVLRMKLTDSPAPNKTKRSLEDTAGSSPHQSESTPKEPKRSPLSTKEIGNVNVDKTSATGESAIKKHSVETMESTPKRPRRGLRLPGSRKKSTSAPGLGEPGKADPNAENECKQS